MTIWGTGAPRREFLHVDDRADALVFLLKDYSDYEHVNVGSGEDLSIYALARMAARAVDFEGKIVTDPGKPDGTPRKLMSGERPAAMGWRPKIALDRESRKPIAGTSTMSRAPSQISGPTRRRSARSRLVTAT